MQPKIQDSTFELARRAAACLPEQWICYEDEASLEELVEEYKKNNIRKLQMIEEIENDQKSDQKELIEHI